MSEGTTDTDLRPTSRNDIDRVLAELKHLNLSGSVVYEIPKWPVARGGYGDVFKGTHNRPDGSETKVAIKCLMVYLDGTRDTARIFKREIQAWSRLSHPNILPLLGYILEGTGSHVSFPLISEWMANGNILDFVINNPGCGVLKLALDMANGLAYLHEKNIVHSDLKSANVLVSDMQRAVICDFGSSHITHNLYSFNKSSDVTGLRGTSRWLAYELLAEPEQYPAASKASDTWAFGMTVYEILTKGYPYAHIKFEPQVIASIASRKLPQTPEALHEDHRKQLWYICTLCWTWEPFERPSMIELKSELDQSSHLDSSLALGNSQQRHRKPAETVFEEVSISKSDTSLAILDGLVAPIQHTQKPIKWQKGTAISYGIKSNVHLAINMSTGKHFVVKQVKIRRHVVLPHLPQRGPTADAVEEPIFESEILKDLKHRNIVEYLGSTQTNKFLNVFIGFVTGGSIATHLKSHGKFEDLVVRYFANGIVCGLSYLHASGVIHRDLNSDNILIDGRGTCKICDFSESRRVSCVNDLIQITQAPTRGSAWSMTPEVTKCLTPGAPRWYNCKVDIWSLGYVVLEMWAGRPDRGINPFRPSYWIPPNLILGVDNQDFMNKCLADEPHERPSASELFTHPYLVIPPGWKFRGF